MIVCSGCADDEAGSETLAESSSATSQGSASSAGATSTESSTGGAESSSGGSTGAESSSGSESSTSGGMDDDTAGPACGDAPCDGATQYCHEHIADAPSWWTCEPLPRMCVADPTCDCIGPAACPEAMQTCEVGDDGVTLVHCEEG